MRLYTPDKNLDIDGYVERCLQLDEIYSVEIHKYAKITYKDALGEFHERYYDVSNGSFEMEKDEGEAAFNKILTLDQLVFDDESGSYPLPDFLV